MTLVKSLYSHLQTGGEVGDKAMGFCLRSIAHLVAISIEKVEDVGEIVLRLPLREQEEQDHHVRHG